MATFPHGGASSIWADTDGGSPKNPDKAEIRDYMQVVEGFDDVAAVLADTNTYTAGTILRTRKEGFAYECVAASGNLGQTTAGGQELDVLPGEKGYNVKAFGAVGDGATDDLSAFAALTAAVEANDIDTVVIPPAAYHLSDYWIAPKRDLFRPLEIVGHGATLDETVVFNAGINARGLRVSGSPDNGFVFTRGHGAHFDALAAESNDGHGFYWGIASRQVMTLTSVSGTFSVGETVTGGTSGETGKVLSVDGSQITIVLGTGIFTASETITGGTSGATGTLDSVTYPYGANYQHVRSTLTSCVAVSNAKDGFHWDGTATANRSWFNANSVVSCSAVTNTGKGFHARSYTGAPGGDSQHNYNTFINLNAEGNSDKSLKDEVGRQNTYLGGHYVDDDGSNSFELLEVSNFILGGRYLTGISLADGNDFVVINNDFGGWLANLKNIDELEVTGKFQADNEPFLPAAWSTIPAANLTATTAGDSQTGHTLDIDLSAEFGTAECFIMKLNMGSVQNFSGGYNDPYLLEANILVSANTSGTGYVVHDVVSTINCSVTGVAISGGVVTVTFDTTANQNPGAEAQIVCQYKDRNSTDFRA